MNDAKVPWHSFCTTRRELFRLRIGSMNYRSIVILLFLIYRSPNSHYGCHHILSRFREIVHFHAHGHIKKTDYSTSNYASLVNINKKQKLSLNLIKFQNIIDTEICDNMVQYNPSLGHKIFLKRNFTFALSRVLHTSEALHTTRKDFGHKLKKNK